MDSVSIPARDLRVPDPDADEMPTWLVVFGLGLAHACIAWPVALVLEVLHLFGKVSQGAPEFAAAWPFMAQAFGFAMFAWCVGLMEGIPAVVRAAKRFRNADKRRVRRLIRDIPSPRKGEVLACWHRAHHEALDAGFDPAQAVRRADAAILRR